MKVDKKKYIYKRTMYKIGDNLYKRVDENKLICEKNKNGFKVSITFLADSLDAHYKTLREINDMLIKTI